MATAVKARNTIDKHPDEVLTLAFEFVALLASGETLSSGQAVSQAGGTPALTIDQVAISASQVTCRVQGGDENTDGTPQTYCLTCTVMTSSGNTRVIVGDLRVADECA